MGGLLETFDGRSLGISCETASGLKRDLLTPSDCKPYTGTGGGVSRTSSLRRRAPARSRRGQKPRAEPAPGTLPTACPPPHGLPAPHSLPGWA